jgi:hypothetical protein
MDREIAPHRERVAVVGEPEPLVMVNGSCNVANAEGGIETRELLQSVEDRDLRVRWSFK